MDHLRYSGLAFETQRSAFLDIVSADPLVRDALVRARTLDLPDWLVVSGALYNSVWNHLTGKPSGYGIKDVDLFYFDGTDLAYEAEDAVIRRAGELVRGRLTVVKIAKPDQDMRFDVPVVGLPTIETMIAAGATCLCLTAGKTLMFDREEMIALANRHKIAIIAV